jgi:hypothetical protein
VRSGTFFETRLRRSSERGSSEGLELRRPVGSDRLAAFLRLITPVIVGIRRQYYRRGDDIVGVTPPFNPKKAAHGPLERLPAIGGTNSVC